MDPAASVCQGVRLLSAYFTLDVYGHVTQKMKQERANRMEQFFIAVNA